MPDGRIHLRLYDLLLTPVSVQNVKRTRSSHLDEPVEKEVQHFKDDPNTPIRRAAHSLNMSHRTIQCIPHDIRWYPYLASGTVIARKRFGESPGVRSRRTRAYLIDQIPFTELTRSEETYFILKGCVNPLQLLLLGSIESTLG